MGFVNLFVTFMDFYTDRLRKLVQIYVDGSFWNFNATADNFFYYIIRCINERNSLT